METPTWESLIVGVRVRSRAVHKPLLVLMILGRAQRGGPANVFRFRDLDEPLREALQAFGPPRKRPSSESAFWSLKDDGFWVVHDEARIARAMTSTRPSRRLLLAEDAAAEVPRELWDELVQEPARVARLVKTVLETHWEDPSVRARVAAEVVFGMRVEEDELG